MKLHPAKKDLSRLLSLLSALSKTSAPLRAKGSQDWAAATAKTLEAGKLEDFDAVEFVRADHEAHLAGRDPAGPALEHARGLVALIEELRHLGVQSGTLDEIHVELSGWKA